MVTLHQALACCRSEMMANCLLFSPINFVQRDGDFIAVYHGDYESEVQSVTNNLVPLCHKHFGKEVKVWFTYEAWNDNAHLIYEWETQGKEKCCF